MAEVPEWYREFVAAVVARLPIDIDETSARRWIDDPQGLDLLFEGLAAGAGTIGALKHDKAAEGWQLLEDIVEPDTISGDTIELAPFQEEGEDGLFGDEVVERMAARAEPKLGQRHAEYLLDRPDEIPEEFRKFSLVFPGTIWLSPDGNHQVPCATYRQGEWSLTFGILEGGLDSSDQIVQLRQ
jgi:hypothetical protein